MTGNYLTSLVAQVFHLFKIQTSISETTASKLHQLFFLSHCMMNHGNGPL